MNHTSGFKNRTHLWQEQLAPEQDRAPETDAAAEPNTRPNRPKLGFARRATEHLEPVYAPEPIEIGDEALDDEDDFRPGRGWWRPKSREGRIAVGAAGGLLLLSLLGCGYFVKRHLEADSRFVLAADANVQTMGATELSRADLLPLFKDDIGKSVFAIPLAQRRKQLEQVSWVQKATLMRVLPNQLRVTVVERTPVALVRETPNDENIGLVDADGVLLKMPPELMARHHYSFPVVTGIDARDPLKERQKRMAVYARLIHELDSGNRKLSEQISEIDLRDPNDARVLMPEAGADILAHFGSDHFLERYMTYQSHIAEWRQQYPKLAAVDLRYERQVVLKQSDGGLGETHEGEKQIAAEDKVAKSGDVKAETPKVTSAATKTVASKPEVVKTQQQTQVAATNPKGAEAKGKSADAKGKVTPVAVNKTGKSKSDDAHKAKQKKAAAAKGKPGTKSGGKSTDKSGGKSGASNKKTSDGVVKKTSATKAKPSVKGAAVDQ